MKFQKSKLQKIMLIFSILTIFIMNIVFLNLDLNSNQNVSNKNDIGKSQEEYPLDQGLDSENVYSGIGDPWNVTHIITRSDSDVESSFNEGSNDLLTIPLESGWEGYNLDADIKNIYDKRDWCNGTFQYGVDNGYSIFDNDSSDISNNFQNWTFHSYDIPAIATNQMAGNYEDNLLGHDCLELYMRNGSEYLVGTWWFSYDPGDKCMWNSTIKIERGKVIDATLNFDYNPYAAVDLNVFAFHVYINNIKIYSRGLRDLEIDAGVQTWDTKSLRMIQWANKTNVFPNNPLNDTEVSISFVLESLGANMLGFDDRQAQQIYIDNVELITKTEVKPDQIGLKLNGTDIQTIDWGKGRSDIEPTGNNWQGFGGMAYFNFSDTDTGTLGTHSVEFKMDSTLYAIKSGLDSTHELIDSSIGSSFSTENNSVTDWVSYGFIRVPNGYIHQNLTMNFPEDYTITAVYDPQFPTTNIVGSCDISTNGLLIVPTQTISATPDGFWKVEARSPNYCENINIFVDDVGSWVENKTILNGDTVNIRANITTSNAFVDISPYIDQTSAVLRIKYPNGTIWDEKTQIIQSDINGFINFTPFTIPNVDLPDYVAGEYQAIVTWNNSYLTYGINETGVIYTKFSVVHNSVLTADQGQTFFDNIYENSTINLKVDFKDSINDDPISGADVYTYELPFPSGVKQNFSEISPGFYFLEYNVSGAALENNTLTIYANSTFYQNKKLNFTVYIVRETELSVNTSILTNAWNENFSIQFNYTEKNSGTGIATTPTHDWVGEATIINPSLGEYIIECNTSLYQINQLHNLNLQLTLDGYQSQTVEITIEITERETILEELRLNDTLTSSIVFPYGEMLNISVKYTDVESGQLIDTNEFQLKKGPSVIGTFTKHPTYNFYNYSINTSNLDIGVNGLTIYANKDNYSSSQLTDVTVTVNERSTALGIKLNDTLSTNFDYYNLTVGEYLNITVWYQDILKVGNPNIDGATIELTGVGAPKSIDRHPSLDQYNISITAEELGQGVKFLTITASKENYSLVSEIIKVSVSARTTNLTLFVNGTFFSEGAKYEAKVGEHINVTITFIDVDLDSHIFGASVNLLGEGLLTNHATYGQYNITLNADDLGQGVNFYSIIAQKINYQPQTINFFIEIIEVNTTLQLYLNDLNKTIEESIEVTIGDIVNITVFYDDDSGAFISNAGVEISGVGFPLTNLTQNVVLEHYNITVDTNDLGRGVNILTLTAGKTNYQQHTIKIKIIINDKATGYQVFIEQQNKTLELFYEITLGASVNVTLLYYENGTNIHLDNAQVEIKEGSDGIGNFTEIGQQYEIILNASDLSVIGLKILTITAQKNNYQTQSIKIRINIKPILGEIKPEDGKEKIDTKPGEDVKISVILEDLESGGRIYNASVTYTWELGDGDLKDDDNDGIYEATIKDVPEGTFTITISVDAGENYDFERLEITLNVIKSKENPLLFQILTGVGVAAAVGLTIYLIAYQKVLKYPKPVRKVRNYRKKMKKKKAPKDLEITSRKAAFTELYQAELEPLGKGLKVKPHEKKPKPDKIMKVKPPENLEKTRGESPK